MKLMLYEEWIKSPHQEDGIPLKKEMEIRNEILDFMLEYGCCLILYPENVFKAVVLFHRFSAQMSFKKFDRFLYAASATFLAAKLDDLPRPLENAVKYYIFLTEHKRKYSQIKTTEKENSMFKAEAFHMDKTTLPQQQTQELYEEFSKSIDKKKIMDKKEKFCDAEVHILKLIGYDLEIDLPYRYLEEFSKKFELIPNANIFMKVAKNFANDTFRTTLCLYYPPHIIALAALHLTQCYLSDSLNDFNGKKWFKFFTDETSEEEIKQAAEYLKEFYSIMNLK